MSKPVRRRATYQDVLDAPPEKTTESMLNAITVLECQTPLLETACHVQSSASPSYLSRCPRCTAREDRRGHQWRVVPLPTTVQARLRGEGSACLAGDAVRIRCRRARWLGLPSRA